MTKKTDPYRVSAGIAAVACLAVVSLVFSAAGDGRPGGRLGAGSLFSSTAHAGDLPSQAVWPHERSELTADPQVAYGKLANGFRYILMENRNPKDRVSLHLNVMAGAMQESDAQRGLAHFLEHMLFNGSTHFPPGELVKYFQSIGMQFGPDANAHTGFIETVYDVLLPDGSRDSIARGLLVMQDFAAGASLLVEEIDRERRVVLAEKRSRDSADYRTFLATTAFEFPDARLSKRIPIGTEDVIGHADRALLLDYYDTWYRPANMVLVLVGDFDPAVAEPLIREMFNPLTDRAPAREAPAFGKIAHEGVRAFHHFEKEAGKTEVTIEAIEQVAAEHDSLALQQRLLVQNIAERMVQNRLDARVRAPDSPITLASIGSGVFLGEAKIATISAECKPENWEIALESIEQSLRQALLFGFTDQELDRVKRDFLAELDNAVKQAATRESGALARSGRSSLNRDRVFMSPAQEKKIFAPIVLGLTPQMVHRAFTQTWAPGHRLVLVTGNADLKSLEQQPEQRIVAAYTSSRAVDVAKVDGLRSVAFPYLPQPGETGKIIRRETFSDIGVTTVDFENGVRLNLKPTDFKADEVMAVVSFGFGKSSQPGGRAGLSELAVSVVNESGFGGLSRDDRDRALAGKSTDVVFGVGEDHFFLKGTTVGSEIPLLFQLVYTFLKDPAFRDEAYELSMARFRQQYAELSSTTEGAMVLKGRAFFAGGDDRFGLPPYERFSKLTLDDVRGWIGPIFESADLEFSIVGDFAPDTVIDLAARYLGSLPQRHDPTPPPNDGLPPFPFGISLGEQVETKIPKGLVVMAYPTTDQWQIGRSRRLSVLAEVFSDRLRERIREKLGAAYSPYAYNRPSRAYPGYGVFQALVQTAPDQTDVVVDEIKAIAGEISLNGVSPDALHRALEPTVTSIKDMLRTNGYWLNTVLTGSRRHPVQFEWARSIAHDYAAITAGDLNLLAKQYLDNDKLATFVAVPEKPE